MENLLNGNNSVDLVKIGVCYMLQYVMAETALIALTSRLLFLVKTLPLLDANMLAYLTGTDNSPVIHFVKECIVSAAFLFVSCPLQTMHGLDFRHRTSAKITLFQTRFNSKYIISELDDKLL
ncbi:hypothetical protein NC651_002082 [Populus alba x Populus x berolinensis]|nr:hypothetical protein NC651_002082 [Populus alba x Populus x berolinensis]